MSILHDSIPGELKKRAQWVGFKLCNGKKKPFIADDPDTLAKCNDPDTWRPFRTAADGVFRGEFDALAYCLNGDFIGVDLDHCFTAGKPSPVAAEIVRRCESYTEKSVSGTGLHILLRGALPGDKGFRRPDFELYGRARFFIVTGNRLPNTPTAIQENAAAVEWLRAQRKSVTEQAQRGSVTEQAEQAECNSIASPPVLPEIGWNSTETAFHPGSAYSVAEVLRLSAVKRQGERNARLFDLARGLRFNCGKGATPLAELKPIVREWYTMNVATMRTKDFVTTWAEFVTAWPKARNPLGVDMLAAAWERAKSDPAPKAAEQYDTEPARRLVALCHALAVTDPERRFFLSTHTAGQLVGIQSMQAHRYLRMLEADGVLAVVSAGDKHRATRYRWTAAE